MPKNSEIQNIQSAAVAEKPGRVILHQKGPNGSWGTLEILMPQTLNQNPSQVRPYRLHTVALHKGEPAPISVF